MNNKVLFFIDLGFLSKLNIHLGEGYYIPFKIKNFVENICLGENFDFEKIFLYTAPPFQSNNPTREQIRRKVKYDSFRSSLIKEGIIFREGRVQRLKVNDGFEYKQKGVDILLALDLSHIKEDYPLIKKIVLISSDTDFCPILEDLNKRGTEIILYTYFDRKRGSPFSLSNHLLKVCSRWIKIKKEDFENAK